MSIKSEFVIDVPAVDILSYVFDNASPSNDFALFQNVDNNKDKLTKLELKIQTQRLGAGLNEVHNIQENEVVMLVAKNCVRYPIIYLGTLCAGGVFCGTNPTSTSAELLKSLRLARPKVLFVDLASLMTVEQALELYMETSPAVYIMEDKSRYGTHCRYQHLDDLLVFGIRDWDRLYGIDVVAKRVAMLAFSSGTTGPPKACALSHYNLVANSEQKTCIEYASMTTQQITTYSLDRRYLAHLPMYHAKSAGMIMHIHNIVRTGAQAFVMADYSLPRLIEAVQRFAITDLMLVPPIIFSMIKSGQDLKYPLRSLARIISGAAGLGIEAAAEFRQVLGRDEVIVTQAWGMTEVTAAATLFKTGNSDGNTVGQLLANMEAKVLGPDGQHVGYGQRGEAVLRGPNVFIGYWRDPDATAKTMTHDGWLRTGDLVVVDQDQVFTIVGRSKELIKVKGFQVSPIELEDILRESKDVTDCAIIGVKRNGNEYPQAHIVRSHAMVTEKSIKGFFEPKVSAYKWLKGGVIFVDAIPRSPAGKILRKMIKDPFEKDGQARL